MTDAQWYFEFHALKQKETEMVDAALTISKLGMLNIREMMVQLLGLNLFSTDEDFEVEIDNKGTKTKISSIIPLIWLAGNPDLLKHAADSASTEDKISDSINDPEFEEFSKALMAGESDMEPYLGSTDPQEQMEEMWHSPYMQNMLDALGVHKTVDRTAPMNVSTKVTTPPRPRVPNKPKKKVKISFNG